MPVERLQKVLAGVGRRLAPGERGPHRGRPGHGQRQGRDARGAGRSRQGDHRGRRPGDRRRRGVGVPAPPQAGRRHVHGPRPARLPNRARHDPDGARARGRAALPGRAARPGLRGPADPDQRRRLGRSGPSSATRRRTRVRGGPPPAAVGRPGRRRLRAGIQLDEGLATLTGLRATTEHRDTPAREPSSRHRSPSSSGTGRSSRRAGNGSCAGCSAPSARRSPGWSAFGSVRCASTTSRAAAPTLRAPEIRGLAQAPASAARSGVQPDERPSGAASSGRSRQTR